MFRQPKELVSLNFKAHLATAAREKQCLPPGSKITEEVGTGTQGQQTGRFLGYTSADGPTDQPQLHNWQGMPKRSLLGVRGMEPPQLPVKKEQQVGNGCNH